MPRAYVTPTPPQATRRLAAVLPRQLAWLACASVHTVSADYDATCVVCGRDWTGRGRRRWLTVYGTRAPRRGQPPETSLHVRLGAGVELHCRNGFRGRRYWVATWRFRGDTHSAHLRPHLSFSHRNVSAQARREQAMRELPELDFDD